MLNANDPRPAGPPAAAPPAESPLDLALTVVPAQPPALALAGLDDLPFESVWPPFTAWWMLGADSD